MTAVRGQKQIDEAFEGLQKRSNNVSSSVDPDGNVTLKGHKRGRDEDDVLDCLWSDTIVQSGPAARTSTSTTGGRTGRRTTPTARVTATDNTSITNSNKAITTRNQLFGKAEHTLLKCKQLKDSLTNQHLIQTVSVKNVQAVLDEIKQRTQDKYLQVYAVDYQAAADGRGLGFQTLCFGACRLLKNNRRISGVRAPKLCRSPGSLALLFNLGCSPVHLTWANRCDRLAWLRCSPVWHGYLGGPEKEPGVLDHVVAARAGLPEP